MQEFELPSLHRRIRVKLRSYGTKRFHGQKTYQFGAGACVTRMLESRQWSIEKTTKHYLFATPPVSSNGHDHLTVEITVPTEEQVLDVARRVFSDHPNDGWAQGWGELLARYYPRWSFVLHEVDPFTGRRGPDRDGGSVSPVLFVGEHGVFLATVSDVGGDLRYSESTTLAEPSEESLFDCFTVADGKGVNAPATYVEGSVRQIELDQYERDPRARAACIAHWGVKCVVCDFDFKRAYGDIGAGYIEVHHLLPLARTIGTRTTDPVNDLRPLCANCHAMIHAREPILSPEELRALLDIRRRTPGGCG